MKKFIHIVAGAAIALSGFLPAVQVGATVTPGSVTSLVTDPVYVKASSSQVALFSFTLAEDAGETLSSVEVMLANQGSSTATGSEFAAIKVLKDDGDGLFEPGVDVEAGSETTVNVGSATVVTTGSNNTIDGGKFFVSLQTSGSWSDSAPADEVRVTLPADAIVTSANSPTITAVTTASLIADTTMPTLVSAEAKNTGGTAAKEAGDSIVFKFSETTNKPAITAGNISGFFTLNNSHSFLDGVASLGGAVWSTDGKEFTLTLSAGTSVPTVVPGDTVTVVASSIKDLAGNFVSGNKVITGDFTTIVDDDEGEDEDEDNEEGLHGRRCANDLINGRLYKVGNEQTVYLAAACRLKPFRGAAVFHSRGHKFGENIIKLDSLPEDVVVSKKPVLPAAGTLVRGQKDLTVFFINKNGKRQGFTSERVFKALGFKFEDVDWITDSDLNAMPEDDEDVDDENHHPDGVILKCGNSAAVFQVIGNTKFPFASIEAFRGRGNSFDHVLTVDCGRFKYVVGAAVNED